MKKSILLLALMALMTGTVYGAAPDLTYNGEVLPWNKEWQRAMSGSVSESLGLPEVSGIACSRVTPGYIWMESDDYTYVVATDETGSHKFMQINFPNLKSLGVRRYDWEDMCGGVYGGKDYLFIGAFGDNDEVDDFYTIIYFEEPAITDGAAINIDPGQIEFVYPDGKSHNCEALMYDNKEQMLYIITKVYYNVCQVFRLPFRLDYGSTPQELEYVCDLGVKADLGEGDKADHGFHLVTAADVSPDGQYVLIKNHNNTTAVYSWILLWERDGDESLSVTLKRQPQPLYCYDYEWQGEAICWLDDETFYTTSDSDGEPPIYKYTKAEPIESVERSFIIDGNFDDWADLKGLAHAEVIAGAELDNLYGVRWYADEQHLYFYFEFNADNDIVNTADILLSVDEDPSTGFVSNWLWVGNVADILIEGGIAEFSEAGFFLHNSAQAQTAWDWVAQGIENIIEACTPITLANTHAAIEGRLDLTLFPIPVHSIHAGVFTGKANWAGDSGCLPASSDQMLEVPIYTPSTGIETSRSNEAACKILRDGHIYILRGNKVYDLTGNQLE